MLLFGKQKVIAILLFGVLAVSKNVAPRASVLQRDLTDAVPSSANRAQSHHPERYAAVSESHVFYQNYQTEFSWDDEKLKAALGIRKPAAVISKRRQLQKRAPVGPVWKVPSCLGCIKKAQGEVLSLNDLTITYLENQILRTDSELKDRCVFYTGVLPSEQAARKLIPGRHDSLSDRASTWACSQAKFSIWHLFPGKNDETTTPDNPVTRNFWEVKVPDSWLYFLFVNNEENTYFQRMSTAMAKHCGGTVYVMCMDPDNIQQYARIWGDHEYPTLLSRYQTGGGLAPKQLIIVKAADPAKQYYAVWGNTPSRGNPLKRSDPNYWHFDEDANFGGAVGKRDTCAPNVDYEPLDEDWFG